VCGWGRQRGRWAVRGLKQKSRATGTGRGLFSSCQVIA
jgi:hypothetical protein